jgi:hypothetical protein
VSASSTTSARKLLIIKNLKIGPEMTGSLQGVALQVPHKATSYAFAGFICETMHRILHLAIPDVPNPGFAER